MTDTSSQPVKKTTPCIGCGGSGQTSFFGGASRFMFTWEDCPDCHGTGITLDEAIADEPNTLTAGKSSPIPPSTSGEVSTLPLKNCHKKT